MSLQTLDTAAMFQTAAAREDYNPSKGWDSIAQPKITSGFTVADYLEVTSELLPNLGQKIDSFLDREGLRAIHVSQSIWRATYENDTIPFRKWLEDYCISTGQALQADVLIVDPCAKGLNRSEGKLHFDASPSASPAYTKDYARSMAIVLEGYSASSKKRSMDLLGNTIDSIENAPETLAYNNQFAKPHKHTGYRGYHAIWNTGELTDGSSYLAGLGLSINAEFKLEHESQQDVNRLTRHLLEKARASQWAQSQFHTSCGIEGSLSGVKSHTKSLSLIRTVRMANDYMNSEKGFDRFLLASVKAAYDSPSGKELGQQIKKISLGDKTTHGDLTIRNLVAQSGLEIRGVQLPSYVPIV